MSELLDSHELDYTRLVLRSVYTASMSLTFEVTLNSSNFGDEEFVSFQSYFSDDLFTLGGFAVEEDNRGLLGVESSGKHKHIHVRSMAIHAQFVAKS